MGEVLRIISMGGLIYHDRALLVDYHTQILFFNCVRKKVLAIVLQNFQKSLKIFLHLTNFQKWFKRSVRLCEEASDL